MCAEERETATKAMEPVDSVLGIGFYARPSEEAGVVMDQRLSIGAFSRRSRLSMKALRLYERLEVLTPAHVDQSNGYRWYLESQLAAARLVGWLRRLDMPLTQVAEVLSATGRPQRAELIASYWEAVERRIASQRELAAHLQIRLQGQQRSFAMYAIEEREVPEQLVLTEQRHVYVKDLQDFIGDAIPRLMRAADEQGGMLGPMFFIYHGEVNEDSDGPVEICVPIDPAVEASGKVATRREPAHREAYTRLRKAQVQYPQILSAFDAVAEWIGSEGRSNAGSPREVYFTDFMAAGPADEVCDVAFPIR